jgi:DNA polymerase III subunit epsilon
MGLDHLPASVAFCDVETTGLGNHDRIVSFGGIGMISRDLAKGRLDLAYLYLVFDPGMGNHRNAEQIHGFSDSALRLQDPFAVHAADVWRFLTSYELLVAHNAAFDLRFINREIRLSGLPALTGPVYCTMQAYRALDLGGSASLSAVCRHIKLARAGDLHDAIEDACDLVPQSFERLQRFESLVQGLARSTRVKHPIPDRNDLVLLRDRRQTQDLPAPRLHKITAEVIEVHALHDDDDHPGLLAVKPRH